jgi:hypothetical protein
MRIGKTADKLIPNPKAWLREVMRFKQFSLRTEQAYLG